MADENHYGMQHWFEVYLLTDQLDKKILAKDTTGHFAVHWFSEELEVGCEYRKQHCPLFYWYK